MIMKMINIKKLAVLASLTLGGCVSSEGLEKRIIENIRFNDSLPTSALSNYTDLNSSNYLFGEQSGTSDRLIEFTDIRPTYDLERKSDNGKKGILLSIFLPEMDFIFHESTELSDIVLKFELEFDPYLGDRRYHEIEYRIVNFLRYPTSDYLERATTGLSVGYISNLELVKNFRENFQREFEGLISRGLEEIGMNDVNTKVSTKGLRFKSGNRIFTLGETLKFEYTGLDNNLNGTCKGRLSGISDKDYLFGCRGMLNF